MRLAANQFGLEIPYFGMEYTDHGPIDATNLSTKEHPLLLRSNVIAVDGTTNIRVQSRGTTMVSPDSEAEKKSEDETDVPVESIDFKGNQHLCCAIPENFYEVCAKQLRRAPLFVREIQLLLTFHFCF